MSNLEDLINDIENNLKIFENKITLKTLDKQSETLNPLINDLQNQLIQLNNVSKTLGFDPDPHHIKYLKYKIKYLKLKL